MEFEDLEEAEEAEEEVEGDFESSPYQDDVPDFLNARHQHDHQDHYGYHEHHGEHGNGEQHGSSNDPKTLYDHNYEEDLGLDVDVGDENYVDDELGGYDHHEDYGDLLCDGYTAGMNVSDQGVFCN